MEIKLDREKKLYVTLNRRRHSAYSLVRQFVDDVRPAFQLLSQYVQQQCIELMMEIDVVARPCQRLQRHKQHQFRSCMHQAVGQLVQSDRKSRSHSLTHPARKITNISQQLKLNLAGEHAWRRQPLPRGVTYILCRQSELSDRVVACYASSKLLPNTPGIPE